MIVVGLICFLHEDIDLRSWSQQENERSMQCKPASFDHVLLDNTRFGFQIGNIFGLEPSWLEIWTFVSKHGKKQLQKQVTKNSYQKQLPKTSYQKKLSKNQPKRPSKSRLLVSPGSIPMVTIHSQLQGAAAGSIGQLQLRHLNRQSFFSSKSATKNNVWTSKINWSTFNVLFQSSISWFSFRYITYITEICSSNGHDQFHISFIFTFCWCLPWGGRRALQLLKHELGQQSGDLVDPTTKKLGTSIGDPKSEVVQKGNFFQQKTYKRRLSPVRSPPWQPGVKVIDPGGPTSTVDSLGASERNFAPAPKLRWTKHIKNNDSISENLLKQSQFLETWCNLFHTCLRCWASVGDPLPFWEQQFSPFRLVKSLFVQKILNVFTFRCPASHALLFVPAWALLSSLRSE